MTGPGVPAGAIEPVPAFRHVAGHAGLRDGRHAGQVRAGGSAGRWSRRGHAACPSSRLPTADAGANIRSTCPPSRSVMAGPAPFRGCD